MRSSIPLAAVLCLSLSVPAKADGLDSMLGTYEVEQVKDFRTSTISKITLDKYKGESRLHVWYYAQPVDIDWGSCILKEFSKPGDPNALRWTADLHHDHDDALLILAPFSPTQLQIDAFTTHAISDAKHPNLATSDLLRKVEAK